MAKELGRTARYYKYGSTVPGKGSPANAERARKVKDKKSTEVNARPEQKAKRRELDKKRRAMLKKGVNLEGKDLAHTKSGIRVKDSSTNRGSTSDMPGDKRARAKGRKMKKG